MSRLFKLKSGEEGSLSRLSKQHDMVQAGKSGTREEGEQQKGIGKKDERCYYRPLGPK